MDQRLTALLRPDGDVRLQRFVTAMSNAERPESIIVYIRGAAARALLQQIGDRELELTHAAFDALPPSNAVEHLRALLVHHGGLPPEGSDPVVRFRAWLAAKLASLPDDSARANIQRFATWRHLRRIRDRQRDESRNLTIVIGDAKQEITEAGKFLAWLRAAHDAGPEEIRQAHVDEYLADGPTTRAHIRNYVHWLAPASPSRARKVDAPYRRTNSVPAVTHEQRLQMVRNCLEMDQVALSTRIAGLIALLWAQPLSRIVMLSRKDIDARPDGIYLRLGAVPTQVPPSLTALFATHCARPSNQQTGNTGTDWVFPGGRAGQHLRSDTLSRRLKVLGIDTQRARNTTLQALTREVDARTLIDMLGYGGVMITKHAARSGASMADYVAIRANMARFPADAAPAPQSERQGDVNSRCAVCGLGLREV